MINFNKLSFDFNDSYLILRNNKNIWIENTLEKQSITFYKKDTGLIVKNFNEASNMQEEKFDNELFIGLRRTYSGYSGFEDFSFSISVAIEKQRETFLLSVEPSCEMGKCLRVIKWPAPFIFNKKGKQNYAVMNICQGSLLINGSPSEIVLRDRWDLESGYNFTRSNYMPWYGLVRENETLMAQYLDPFDTGFDCEKLSGDCAKVFHLVHSQLGNLNYCRRLRIDLLIDADYNILAKKYRNFLIENGNFISLKEKIIKNKNLKKLIGSCLIHTNIYSKYSPESFDFIHKNITEKEKVVPFSKRAEQIQRLSKLGIEKAYLHLDGWTKEGYDNQHPDTFPPTEKAGGLKEMQSLIDITHSCGFLFGIHDQYRDLYLDAPSYNKEFSIVNYTGKRYYCSLWAGGPHEALNPIFSLDFVKRNFDLYKKNSLELDGAYLDVFSVIALDESYSKNYPLTRENCAKYRSLCFEDLRNRDLLVQSEEGTSWAIPHLDFTHHMPYWMITSKDENQMIGKIEDEAIGIPVPISSLVFHDSIITPWTNDNKNWKSCSNASLMAIIHGGIPYLEIDEEENMIIQVKKAMKFHSLIAFEELLKHEYLDDDFTIHHSVFTSGYECIVDTQNNTFKIFKDSKLINI